MPQATPADKTCEYIAPALPYDVMAEQLDYLNLHSQGCHRKKCADCARLERVREELLVPFD
ncbi:MAG: hypothetical protein ABSF62_02435 [Bryobacteraceae bacterium]